MARITEKEVHTAAAQLDAQGIKPTASKVREKLGSGSFSTILTYLNTYEGTSKSAEETPEPPEGLDEIVLAIWNKVWDQAAHMFDGERAKYEAKIKNLEDEKTTLEKIIEDQDEKAEQLAGKFEKLVDTGVRQAEQIDKLKEKNAYLQGKIDGKTEKQKPATKKKEEPVKDTKTQDWTESEAKH